MMQAMLFLMFKFFPPLMLVGSIFGFFGVVGLGPKELPKKHPLNRKLACPIFAASIGLYIVMYPEPYITIGLGMALVAFVWYTLVLKQVRDIYPRPVYVRRTEEEIDPKQIKKTEKDNKENKKKKAK